MSPLKWYILPTIPYHCVSRDFVLSSRFTTKLSSPLHPLTLLTPLTPLISAVPLRVSQLVEFNGRNVWQQEKPDQLAPECLEGQALEIAVTLKPWRYQRSYLPGVNCAQPIWHLLASQPPSS